MNKEDKLLQNRFLELSEQCRLREIPVYTDFLTLYEQQLFRNTMAGVSVRFILSGGYELAERKLACFLPDWAEELPEDAFRVVRISPAAPRFAVPCSHRDYLGAVMNLGIERSRFGDLLVDGSDAYLVSKPENAVYVCENLCQVGRNSVSCQLVQPECLSRAFHYDEIIQTVPSLRLDAVLALGFHLSRSKAADACRAELVFLNGKCMTRPDHVLVPGDVISLRGHGKLIFREHISQTKKGRESVRLYKLK